MRIHTAQLPDTARSQDRVFTTDRAVAVLDGASPFAPVDVSTGAYVDALGNGISDQLRASPDIAVADAVAHAIAAAADELGIEGDASPSSTVTVLRHADDRIDLYVLGDSTIYYGDDHACHELADHRLDELHLPERAEYRRRLAHGHGYDDTHRELLADLQREQRKHRNIEGGYWIAEADPSAAHHAFERSVPTGDITWAVLATDGAYEPLAHLGLDDWRKVSRMDDASIASLLQRCETWLKQSDPEGATLPRSKVADDMTIAAVDLRSL
ncbi:MULTISPECIES: protein phosphatase 2C domain-containing protein [Prauserella salsuginis group]|uniref:Protein phosphatase 2C domain-containing protein n=1 Tax=Prauserella salsuginis TaxID=387889 RepID=A0ABW6FX98_9PSEU|nr:MULTISPECIES: protein phosphatase 2C domain-containing protein [Prauserella salsuginis group]MCR3720171.1 Protein phosphatase 2C [Prauserella flava]MCR3734120.1 Protein phosphatase 2C [Prauserella salsuginis]